MRYAGQDKARIRAALERALVAHPELKPSLDELVDFFALYTGTVPQETRLRVVHGYGYSGPLNNGLFGIGGNLTLLPKFTGL